LTDLGFDKLSWWLVLLIGLAIGAIAAAIVHFVLRSWMRNRAIRMHYFSINIEASVSLKGDQSFLFQD
jgi:hypothetical protein